MAGRCAWSTRPDSLRPATISSATFSNSEPAWPHCGVRSTWLWSLFDFSFQSHLDDLLAQLFYRDFLRVKLDSQQIGVPFVIHRLDTRKPYQGFFDPVGSVVSQEIQSRAHVFDMECNGYGCRIVGLSLR